jgi:hypothetical protein
VRRRRPFSVQYIVNQRDWAKGSEDHQERPSAFLRLSRLPRDNEHLIGDFDIQYAAGAFKVEWMISPVGRRADIGKLHCVSARAAEREGLRLGLFSEYGNE